MKEKVIEKVKQDIEMNKILIGYLEEQKKSLPKDKAAQIDIKIEQLQKEIMFNEGFVDYASKI